MAADLPRFTNRADWQKLLAGQRTVAERGSGEDSTQPSAGNKRKRVRRARCLRGGAPPDPQGSPPIGSPAAPRAPLRFPLARPHLRLTANLDFLGYSATQIPANFTRWNGCSSHTLSTRTSCELFSFSRARSAYKSCSSRTFPLSSQANVDGRWEASKTCRYPCLNLTLRNTRVSRLPTGYTAPPPSSFLSPTHGFNEVLHS